METLFESFPKSSYEDWQKQVTKDLKGESIESLLWENENGFTVKPFYTQEQLQTAPQSAFTHSDWDICEFIEVKNESEANYQALEALQGGASGLVFSISKPINTAVLLKNISVEHIYTQFNISNDATHVINDLKQFDGQINAFSKQMQCFVTLDPIYLLGKYGEWHLSYEQDLTTILNSSYLSVNAAHYHESGAYASTQLGILLAHLNEYLHFLTEKKQAIPNQIHLSLSIGNSFFIEIAKLKAVRHLVNLLLESYNMKVNIHLHAQTALINKSNKDSNTNLLRTTTESMSAVLGGCNSLVTLPFDAGFKHDTSFSRRIARNQQHILKGESYLHQLADVSAGSYYVENIVSELGKKAWDIFKGIENEGGFIKSFETGSIQNRIAKDFNTQQQAMESNEKIMIGVNKFPNTQEKDISDYFKQPETKGKFAAISSKRLA
jgi:methylmalonyl-CoA mutase